MKRVGLLWMLLLVISLISIHSRGGNEAAPLEDDSYWEFPFLNILTGPIASIGEHLQWGAERAAWEINESGGIAGKPVRIKRIDTGMTPEQGALEIARIADSALLVLGPVPEPVILGALPVALEEGIYCFTASTSFEYASPFFPWAVSWFPPTEEALPEVVSAWVEHVGVSRVVQFVEGYGAWPGMAAAHAVGVEAAGGEVVEQVDVPQDAISLETLAVKALAAAPDGVVITCNAEKVAKLIMELQDRGWERMDRILIFSSADDAALYTTGGSRLDGAMIYSLTQPAEETERWRSFYRAFQEEYPGIEPFNLSTNYYDAVYMIKRAIEELGLTGAPALLAEERVMLRDYCNEITDFEGILHSWSNQGGYPRNKPLYLFTIEGGRKKLARKVVAE